jgi:hypothetical protein
MNGCEASLEATWTDGLDISICFQVGLGRTAYALMIRLSAQGSIEVQPLSAIRGR